MITPDFRLRGAAGRWNSLGTILIYTAERPSLAALEIMSAWDDYENFSHYSLYRCEFGSAAVHDAVADLHHAKVDIHDCRSAQRYGDSWLASGHGVALPAHSAMAPASYNYLPNFDHPDFEQAVRRQAFGMFTNDECVLGRSKPQAFSRQSFDKLSAIRQLLQHSVLKRNRLRDAKEG